MAKQEEIIFRDEKISPRGISESKSLPAPLLNARKLARGKSWSSRTSVFLKQAQMLVDYTDDFECACDSLHFMPTYQSLTDAELRGYFTWRAKIRQGQTPEACLAFLQIYATEIINNIGVHSSTDGYKILLKLKENYSSSYETFSYYITIWLRGYIIYYNLPAEYLADDPDIIESMCLSTLANVNNEPKDNVIPALKKLAGKWINRSKFYADYSDDYEEIAFRILKRLTTHYSKGYKRTFIGQYFGSIQTYYIEMFNGAVFANLIKRKKYEYKINDLYIYRYDDRSWYMDILPLSKSGIRKLEILLKSIDGIMREIYGYGHPIKNDIKTKLVLKIIREEIENFINEQRKKASGKISIDLASLDKIRADALITQTRLVTAEEAEPLAPEKQEMQESDVTVKQESDVTLPLTDAEARLLRCLLYNHDLGWLRAEGHLLAVLVDGINAKLYDHFEDNVLDDSPQVLADYVDELQEMFAE